MSRPLDQLVYGWSEDGLEGRNRLQLVATTASWVDDSKYRRVAQRLARLEAAGDRYPISFGWADLGGRRFVFQRTLVPSPTGDARRLVAHVVAGDPADLPVELVLRAYDGGFWWRGEPIEKRLGAVRPIDLARGWTPEKEPEPTLAADALLQRILAAPQGMPATYEGDWRDTYACLWGIQRRVPGLLDSLAASTYETGQMATWFDVAGLDGRPRPHGAPWCARNASEPRYSDAQVDDLGELVAAAGPVVRSAGKQGPKVFREVLRVGERIVSGHAASVPQLLTFPETLPTVLSARGIGVRGVADALWSRERQQWPALTLGEEGLTSLAITAADLATPEADATLTAVARRLQSINPDLGSVFVDRILQRKAEGAALPRPDHGFLAAALRWVYDSPSSEEVMAALLLWAQENSGVRLLADRRVPDPWREWLFAQATSRAQLAVDDYAQLVAQHPVLFAGDGWLPPDDELVLGLLSSEAADLRAVSGRAYAAGNDAAAVAATAVELHRTGRLVGCSALLQALGEREDVRLDPVTQAALWAVLADLARGSVTGRLTVGLLELPWSISRHLTDDGSWIAAAGHLFWSTRHDVGARMRQAPSLLAQLAGDQRGGLTLVALHDAVLHTRTGGGFETWLQGLDVHAAARTDVARTVLTALQRRTGTARQLVPAFVVALDAAVTRSGFLGLRVSAGGFEPALEEQVKRLKADSVDAFADARAGLSWAAARWLKRRGAL